MIGLDWNPLLAKHLGKKTEMYILGSSVSKSTFSTNTAIFNYY